MGRERGGREGERGSGGQVWVRHSSSSQILEAKVGSLDLLPLEVSDYWKASSRKMASKSPHDYSGCWAQNGLNGVKAGGRRHLRSGWEVIIVGLGRWPRQWWAVHDCDFCLKAELIECEEGARDSTWRMREGRRSRWSPSYRLNKRLDFGPFSEMDPGQRLLWQMVIWRVSL